MVPIDESLDESYWRSLLTDQEALIEPVQTQPDRPALTRSADAVSTAGRPIDLRWAAAEQACHCEEIIEVVATGYNRGGLLIDWLGLHGFVPASHLVGLPAVPEETQRRDELGKRVGQLLRAKI